jgi:hypothetical protein
VLAHCLKDPCPGKIILSEDLILLTLLITSTDTGLPKFKAANSTAFETDLMLPDP